ALGNTWSIETDGVDGVVDISGNQAELTNVSATPTLDTALPTLDSWVIDVNDDAAFNISITGSETLDVSAIVASAGLEVFDDVTEEVTLPKFKPTA
ncbi:MAG: hypothetical protein IH795_05360, partial [Bacteroidetes bacterium]|nr:hypothetical protein [Bacteroidota bacterium]